MQIIITNRDHTKPLPKKIKRVEPSFLSNQIGKVKPGQKNRNHLCKIVDKEGKKSKLAKNKQLMFYPHDKRTEIFKGENAKELERQWVVYVHGHHQDPLENIHKTMEIERIHGVNVLAFSWPSHPLITSKQTEAILGTIEQLIIKRYKITGWWAFVASKAWDGIEGLIEGWRNYPLAKENALLSTNDLQACLRVFKKDLFPLTRSKKTPNLVVASLGNYLMENTIKQNGGLAMKFHNVLLHEADANAEQHVNWVPILHKYCNNLSITVNTFDTTLWASTVRNESLEQGDTNRLGLISTGHLVDGKTRYLQLEGMPCAGLSMGCEYEHEYYIRSTRTLIKEAVDLMKSVITSNDDFLPDTNGGSKNGFSKMPTEIQMYKFEYIVMDVDRDEVEPRQHKSLDTFTDPLAPPPVPDPDIPDD